MSQKNNFGIGVLVGAITGAIAGILLAPKSGKEAREDLKQFATETFEGAKDLYAKANESMKVKIAALKRAGARIDQKKYATLVNEVISELKEDFAVTKEVASSVKDELSKDWSKVKKALATKPVKKKATSKA
jgi:gas vesicle protein